MTSPRVINGVDELKALIGEDLGYSDWHEVTQEMVNLFAEATGDHQWIHVDVERAKRESPYGGPIAHGYLTLSLVATLLPEVMDVTGFTMGVNYGADKIRFPAPVPVGSKVRAGARLDNVTDVAGGVQLEVTATIEVEGATKPSCVATVLYRRYL